jgi:hypothetical protein
MLKSRSITLDTDVAAKLKAERKKTRRPFKAIVMDEKAQPDHL